MNDGRYRQHSPRFVSLIRFYIVAMVISVTGTIALLGYLGLNHIYESANQNLREANLDRYKEEIQHIVETVATTIESTVSGEIGPELDRNQQEAVKHIIRGAKFDEGNGYFFLYDMKGQCIAHGDQPDKEGQNLLDLKDADGVPVVKQLRDATQQGGGFVQYRWEKAGQQGTFRKISYARRLRGGVWWLGAGVYVDDVEEVIALGQRKQDRQQLYAVVTLFMMSSGLMTVTLYIGSVLSRIITQPIVDRMKALSRAADEERLYLAGVLHNSISQFILQVNPKMADLMEASDADMRRARVRDCLDCIFEFDDKCHDIEGEIYPVVVDRHGVSKAFTYFLREVEESANAQFVLCIHDMPPSDSGRGRALYLVLQGLTQNVLKHAQASLVEVTLIYDEATVRAIIKDNGKGFNADAVLRNHVIGNSRFGLPWILAQIEVYGGCAEIDSSPGSGTTVSISMPWPQPVDSEEASSWKIGER